MDEMYKVYVSEDYVDNKIEESRAQPNWNQNDPNAADYVKNRTHWVDKEKVDIISHEHSFNNSGEPVSSATLSNGAPPYFLVDEFTGFIVGKTYVVVWDGAEYNCVAREMTRNGYTFVGIGNAKLWTNVSADETSEPFLFYADEYTTSVYSPISGDIGYKEKHSFMVSSATETVHTIDPKFLPAGGSGGAKMFIITSIYSDDGETYAANIPFAEFKAKWMAREPFICCWVDMILESDGNMNNCSFNLAQNVEYYPGNEYSGEKFQISTNGPIFSFFPDESVTAYID